MPLKNQLQLHLEKIFIANFDHSVKKDGLEAVCKLFYHSEILRFGSEKAF